MLDLSIIIPNYNKYEYIIQTIESVLLNKTNLNCEIIIVDDCSTDESTELLKNINIEPIVNNVKHIKNLKIIFNKNNQKLSESRNIGIFNSAGEFIVCLDADDIIPDNYLEANYLNIKNNNVDISYSNSNCFGDSNQIFNWPEYDIYILRSNPFIHASSMYRKKVWDCVGGYDKRFIYGFEDYDFWLSAAKLGFSFKKCNNTFLNYRITKNSMTNEITRKNDVTNKHKLKEKHGSFYLNF